MVTNKANNQEVWKLIYKIVELLLNKKGQDSESVIQTAIDDLLEAKSISFTYDDFLANSRNTAFSSWFNNALKNLISIHKIDFLKESLSGNHKEKIDALKLLHSKDMQTAAASGFDAIDYLRSVQGILVPPFDLSKKKIADYEKKSDEELERVIKDYLKNIPAELGGYKKSD